MFISRASIMLLSFAICWVPAAHVGSEQASLAQRILQVLHADGTLDDAQYRELMSLADEEARQRSQGPAASPKDVRAGYRDGFFIETLDRQFKLQVGGRIQTDWALLSEDADTKAVFGELGSGTEFRRARISLRGQLTEDVRFKMEYDFASGGTVFNDVFLSFQNVPIVGSVKVGHFKEPFGLEALTSSLSMTFMERALSSAFVPFRNSGIGLAGTAAEERFTWAVGVFRETDASGRGFGDDSRYNVSGRLTGIPYRNEEGDRLVHLGLSYQRRFRNNDSLVYLAQPEAHLGPALANTGSLLVDQVNQYQPELAIVWGPLSLQAEATVAIADLDGTQTADFYGHYLYASYFLTGEHRVYEPALGHFKRLRPARNAVRGGGAGAWEIALRYSHLKLDDASVRGGELSDVTLGLNWYLNPFVRVMFNYVNAYLRGVGRTEIWQTRLQADF